MAYRELGMVEVREVLRRSTPVPRAIARSPFPRLHLERDVSLGPTRQAQKLRRLAERYGPERVNAACARALTFELLDVWRVERMVKTALAGAPSDIEPAPGPALPARFVRAPESVVPLLWHSADTGRVRSSSAASPGGPPPSALPPSPSGQTMDAAYRREEIVSSSKASKQLGEVLNEAKRKGCMVLSRNNRLKAMILPIEEYEGIVEDLEHLLTALKIRERKGRGRGKRISWESLKAKHGL